MAYVNDFGDSVAINMSHKQLKTLKELLDKAVNLSAIQLDDNKKEDCKKLYYAIDNFEYENS